MFASFSMRGFLSIESSNKVMILLSIDSLYGFETLYLITLSTQIEPLKTLFPTPKSRGSLSPLKLELSIEPTPTRITPSITTLSPALSSITSPTSTDSTPTMLFSLFFMTVTSLGIAELNPSIVSTAFFLVKTSKYFPANTKVIIIATDSK